MEHIYLIPNERMVLEQRGFFVKSIGSKTDIFDFFLELGMVFGMMVTGIFVLLSSFFIIQEGIGGITDLELSVVFQGVIILGGCIFFIAFTGLSLILLFNKKRFLYEREGVIYLMGKNSSLEISIRPEVVQYKDLGYTLNLFILFGIIPIVLFPKYMFLFFGCVIFLVFLIHTGVQIFHPLYAFGNIGEKIQKFTPEIEKESKLIRSEFEKNQNFAVLHSGFEKLSETFSRIGELVLKLERVEKKANKGNLFDSEKYIGSLRTDIVTPLVELKSFLEKQREELLTSQKELSKVMVGESSELSGNRELASRRGEELLNELDGNIGKLGEMIGKMGQEDILYFSNSQYNTNMQFPPITELLEKIDILMADIHSMKPLSAGELRELQKSLRVMEVYNSNAIEGNTLTLGETKLIIEDGITIGGKSIREMHEAENLAKAIDEIITHHRDITEETILTLHELIMRNIDDENAGIYRKIQVYISGDESRPPIASEVQRLMNELLDWYNTHGDIHPVLLASEFHYRFVKIHPFVDGNGRAARLLANMILISHGYPMIILPVVRRMDYITSLHSLTGSLGIFQNFYADIVHENLRDYMRMIQS